MAETDGQEKKTIERTISKILERIEVKDAALVMIYGPDLGRKFGLGRSKTVVGRSSKSDIQIDQESISRSHCRFDNLADRVVVVDLDSTNGTLVNDERVQQATLQNGDLVKVGRVVFKYIAGGNIESLYHEEIYRLTTYDGLTQIFNKRYFLDVLAREISRSRRYKRALSLLLFDIDHFKQVNDEHGHLAGDHLLKNVAALVLSKIRKEDVFARYGGEEFVIALPECEEDPAAILAERLRSTVEATVFEFEEARFGVTISVGIAGSEPNETDPQALLARADARLYEAKRAGRNRICR